MEVLGRRNISWADVWGMLLLELVILMFFVVVISLSLLEPVLYLNYRRCPIDIACFFYGSFFCLDW